MGERFYCRTPGMGAGFMGWKSPAVRIAKPLAAGKGVRREAESEGSRRQSRPEGHKPHTRLTDLGEPVTQGENRSYQRVLVVNVAGAGGKTTLLSGEA